MRQSVLTFLLFILFGFEIPFNRTWSQFDGWCFQSQKVVSTWICFPYRWGATEIVATQEIKINKDYSLFLGYKWTHSKDIPEFQKEKTTLAHGPYVNFQLKFW